MAVLRIPISDRPALFSALNRSIEAAKAHRALVGLLLIDIKHFTSINRVYEYSYGDSLLYSLSQRLAECAREDNCVFRVGNDEFALIVPRLESSAEIGLEASRVLDKLRDPYQWQGQEINLDVNIGCIALTAARASSERLLSGAEHLLQRAKLENRSFCCGTDTQTEREDSLWLLEQDLLRALHNNELDMVFQPKIDLRSGAPAHAEALLRWQHPERGYIPPTHLVAMLSRLNREFALSKWALHTALRRAREWAQQVPLAGVAVNIPANIVHHPDFCSLVEDSLHIWQVEPCQLTLEITENAIMENRQASFDNLNTLKSRGVAISIDDFGTGYSSLEYFKSIPATELKIDQSFVLNMARSQDDRNIAQLIIELAHRFGLAVVAEGVEELEVLQELKALGCDYAQGYYIARPMPHEDYKRWLRERQLQSVG